ncbi:MAG TPA: hypothetical protein VE988_15940, partial [Gemmataceae bacterium]|nr:hypothetical protein [Gemmataceae bacterium]
MAPGVSCFGRSAAGPTELAILGCPVREQAKATVQWNEMLDEIRGGLRLTFKGLLDALVDRLTARPDGTRKKFVGVKRLLPFLDLFSKKDVADDEQLRNLVDEVGSPLAGQDIKRLRK